MAAGMKHQLSFKVGHEIEVRSFLQGYRGAWFRCKIKDVKIKRGYLGYCVEYYDFPDEKLTWTRLYQTTGKSRDMSKQELMVRPPFPLFQKESETSEQDPSTDVKAVVADAWRVGDSVDLWYDKCYWSGKIKRFVGDGFVEVELTEPPNGEGGIYCGCIGDLRPTLDWSPQNGWTVPISAVNGESWYAARLINSRDSEWVSKADDAKSDDGRKETPSGSNATSNLPIEPSNSTNGASASKFSGDNSMSESLHFLRKNARTNATVLSDDDDCDDVGTPCSGSKANMRQHISIDSSIMELEELANKIRWMKGVLKFGFGWSNDLKPSWKVLPKQ